MPRPKAPHLKRRSDGRYACRYQDMWFYGNTENEALRDREDYKQAFIESLCLLNFFVVKVCP